MDEEFEKTNRLVKWIYFILIILIILVIFISYTNFFFKDKFDYNKKNGYTINLYNSYIYSNGTVLFYLEKYEQLDANVKGIDINKSKMNLENNKYNCKLVNSKLNQTQIRVYSIKYNIFLNFKCENLTKYDILNGNLDIVETQKLYGRDTQFFDNKINFQFKVR